MVFSSPVFLFVFLPVTYLGCRLLPSLPLRNAWLTLASLIFFSFGQLPYLALLLLSVCINYLFGLWLQSKSTHRRLAAGLAAAANLLLLGAFKYTDFLISTVNSLTGAGLALTGIVLPIGISFYTFQGMSYVIDVYRRPEQGTRNPGKLLLYISFFPQLIAGPIVIYHDVAGQINRRSVTPDLTLSGLRRFIAGFGKKMLLANTAGEVADAVFALTAAELDSRLAWLGAVCYTLQIYFDFSGYSDMAIGLGRMLGFEFIENFNYPYISRSVVDFWKRWHISLTTWFREYLYFPLGGNRVPRWKWVRNILIVWLLTGLWHGAGWNFLLWGLYYALFMLAERLFLGKWLEKLPRALQHVYALFVVLIGWALFAVEDMGRLGAYLSACFGGAPLASAADGYYLMSYLPMLLILAVAATPLGKRLWDRAGERAHGVLLPVLTLAGLVLCTASLVDASYNPFLYFRF